jgi:hypothetical protein
MFIKKQKKERIISIKTYIQVDQIYDVLEQLYEEKQQYITLFSIQ